MSPPGILSVEEYDNISDLNVLLPSELVHVTSKCIYQWRNMRSLCSNSCALDGYLNAHMLVHAEEKPLKYSMCSCSCSSRFNLKTHMLVHSGEKSFK